MRQLFAPVVNNVIRLVSQQVNLAMSAKKAMINVSDS
jgi:hypothetical protein